MDIISKEALKAIDEAGAPLETKEISEIVSKSVKGITRTKLFSRLNILWGKGLVVGKFVGPGKGVWIWWKKDAFSKSGVKQK